ncbi:MAG: VanW family protein [Candidatus Magasanikbacteria bacterium]
MKEKFLAFFKKRNAFVNWRFFWILLLISIVLLGIFFVSIISYGYSFKDKVLPGLSIGNVPIGGMNEPELKLFLDNMSDKLINEGLKFSYDINGTDDQLVIYPMAGTGDNAVELAYIDVEKEVERLMKWGKKGGIVGLSLVVLKLRVEPSNLYLQNVNIDEDRLLEEIDNKLSKFQSLPQNANIAVLSVQPLQYEIVSSSVGIIFDYEGLVGKVRKSWSILEPVNIKIEKHEKFPEIDISAIHKIGERLPAIFDDGALLITYKDPHTSWEYSWWITVEDIRQWLQIQKYSAEESVEDEIVLGLEKEAVLSFLMEKIEPLVNVEPKNAKFEIGQNGKVLEFQGSRPGIKIDIEKVYEDINNAIIERTWHDEMVSKSMPLTVEKSEPLIKTGDVNGFGITEILGVGVSDYSRSPINRIKNITNAVNKLNGVLIKPGETFSTLEYTRPFTLEGGYFPELVIKGDEVKPEIGGGLCQIGTTLFRMAMNSAMEIVDRRNHSLVVFHYDDPINGNPGTDATVYDPAPDFKFRNDTDNYVLIQTYMDTKNEELFFTLWGADDGRKGSFSRPVVQRWIPHGDPKIIETTKLDPGKEECQSAFLGADASFTYTRIFSSGEKEETLFESHYRPLPKICLVGVEEKVVCEDGDEDCVEVIEDIVSSTEAIIN